MVCLFVSPLSEEEVQALASPPTPKPEGHERPDRDRKAFLRNVRFEGTLANGKVIRRRIKRLEVPVGSPLRRGQILRLRLAPGESPVARVRVDSCRLNDQGRWVVRGTFVNIDPADVLRSFRRPKPPQ
jgi:hypothetical protein